MANERKSERIKLRKSVPTHKHCSCPCCGDEKNGEEVKKVKKVAGKLSTKRQEQKVKIDKVKKKQLKLLKQQKREEKKMKKKKGQRGRPPKKYAKILKKQVKTKKMKTTTTTAVPKYKRQVQNQKNVTEINLKEYQQQADPVDDDYEEEEIYSDDDLDGEEDTSEILNQRSNLSSLIKIMTCHDDDDDDDEDDYYDDDDYDEEEENSTNSVHVEGGQVPSSQTELSTTTSPNDQLLEPPSSATPELTDQATVFNEFQIFEQQIAPSSPQLVIYGDIPSTQWLHDLDDLQQQQQQQQQQHQVLVNGDQDHETNVTVLEPAPWTPMHPVNPVVVTNHSEFIDPVLLPQENRQWEPEVEQIQPNSHTEQPYQIVFPPTPIKLVKPAPPPPSPPSITVSKNFQQPAITTTTKTTVERKKSLDKDKQKYTKVVKTPNSVKKTIEPAATQPDPVYSHINVLIIGGDEPPLYECTVCDKKFKTKAHIKYHRFCSDKGRKEQDMPFSCRHCGRGFISKSHYEYHLQSHKKKKSK